MGCVLTASVDLVNFATPPLNAADPIPNVPSRSLTCPVSGGPEPVTCAVNVTFCPNCEGFRLELRDVVVGYLMTICFAFPLLGANAASPGYTAFMKCVFTVKAEVVKVATLFAVAPVPIGVRPS